MKLLTAGSGSNRRRKQIGMCLERKVHLKQSKKIKSFHQELDRHQELASINQTYKTQRKNPTAKTIRLCASLMEDLNDKVSHIRMGLDLL